MPATHDNRRRDSGFTQLAAAVAVLLSMASLLAVAFKLDNSGAGRDRSGPGEQIPVLGPTVPWPRHVSACGHATVPFLQ